MKDTFNFVDNNFHSNVRLGKMIALMLFADVVQYEGIEDSIESNALDNSSNYHDAWARCELTFGFVFLFIVTY